MIRKRLVNFIAILKRLLCKRFKPFQTFFLCLVSRETRAPYPVNVVSRIPWNPCLVSRACVSYPVKPVPRIPCFCVSYPVKTVPHIPGMCLVSREMGRPLACVYWLIRWRCCEGVGGLLMMTLSPSKSKPMMNSIFLSSFKAAINFLLKHLISLLLLPLKERIVSILIGYGFACVAK